MLDRREILGVADGRDLLLPEGKALLRPQRHDPLDQSVGVRRTRRRWRPGVLHRTDARYQRGTRSRNALRAANARLQAIFDHAPVWLSLRGMDGRYLDANDELAQVLGHHQRGAPGLVSRRFQADAEGRPGRRGRSHRLGDEAADHPRDHSRPSNPRAAATTGWCATRCLTSAAMSTRSARSHSISPTVVTPTRSATGR